MQDIINQALNGELQESGQLLEVIANINIDITKVAEWWSGYLNDAWAASIKEKTETGFIPFRIQTEFNASLGHVTMIYMAKMKKE